MTNLKSLFIIFALLYLGIVKCEISTKKLFNDNWFFIRLGTNDTINESFLINAVTIPKNWEKVTLPHTPRIEPLIVNDQWQGNCYYAKTFSISKYENRKHFIKFESAMNVADVWVNGKHLKTHLGGYLPFTVDFSDIVRFDKPNFIVVKLDNKDNSTTGPKPLKKLDFNMYGGIYRDTASYVSQISVNGIKLEVYPNPFTTNLNITLNLTKSSTVSIELFDELGHLITKTDKNFMFEGVHNINITPNNILSGNCYLLIRANETVLVKKLVSIKK